MSELEKKDAPLSLTPEEALEEPLPPPPSAVSDLASACVVFVQRALSLPLDFSSETLSILDHYLERVGQDAHQKPEVQAVSLHAAGAYFGEVLRRSFGGWWSLPSEDPETWEVRLSSVYLAIEPVAIARAAAIPGELDAASAILVDDRDRADIEAYLDALPGVSERSFWSPSTRYDVIESIVHLLHSLHQSEGRPAAVLTNADYDDPEMIANSSGVRGSRN